MVMSLACSYELLSQVVSSSILARQINRSFPHGRSYAPTAQAPETHSPALPVPVGQRVFKYLTAMEMEDHHKKGLCYNCEEKFHQRHKCQHLFYIEFLSEPDADEEQVVLEIGEDPDISLHALTDIYAGDTMQLQVRLGEADCLALLDSGSTHPFLRDVVAARASITL